MSKVVVVNKSIKDEKLMDMFAQMTGSKSADPLIIIPKFIAVRKHALIIIKTLEKFSTNEKLRNTFPAFVKYFDQITTYTKNLHASLQYDVVTDENVNIDNIHTLYKTCKDDVNVRSISIMCARLRQDMTVINDLNLHFIAKQPDAKYHPLPFTDLNFYDLWTEMPEESGGEIIKKYILTVFKKLMEKSYEIHNVLISPDIDIDEFSVHLIEAISKARKMLPRCNQAFDKIEESIGLLKNNFSGYYKSFMISKNPNSILEDFIIDVSQKQSGGNMKLKWQFMQIVNFYKKHSSGKVAKNSDLNFIFDTLDDQLDKLSKTTAPEEKEEKEKVEEEVEEINVENMRFGYHHIDLINEENDVFISVVEEADYNQFLEYLSVRSGLELEKISQMINQYNDKLDKTPAIESNGFYRTMLIEDYKLFNVEEYIQKIAVN
jgi:hypothetical protein